MVLSSKSLLIGIYSSNSIIKSLFLPSSYAFLLAPFVLLVAWYVLDENVWETSLAGFNLKSLGLQVVFAATWIGIATRFLSNRSAGTTSAGKRRVPSLPYWVPALRHWGSVVFGGEKWLRSVRDAAITDVVAYRSAGAKHNVILSSDLLDRVVGNTKAFDEAEVTGWTTLQNTYGLSSNLKDQYLQLRPLISETLNNQVFKSRGLESIMSASIHALSQALPDLITYNSSMVDQLDWERVAAIELTDGTDEAECDLFALINQFLCSALIPALTGSQFSESYQLLASDLVTLNQYHNVLALGLPRFFPLPGLPGASLAKRRLLQNFDKLFDELANPRPKRVIEDDESMSGEETDADVPTPMTALNDMFSKHNVPISARSSIALEVVHSIVSQVVPLSFWTILHIYRASAQPQDYVDGETPLVRIRQETQKWAEAYQPPSIHPSFPSPPEISFAGASKVFNPSTFTYLRSCIFETRRLYKSSITTAILTKPIAFADTAGPVEKEEWELEAGTYLDIGLSQRLINTSPANYLSPDQYKPDRFATTQSPAPLAASIFNDAEELVTCLLVTIVAGLTQLWDISAAPKKSMYQQFQEAQAAAAGERPSTNRPVAQEKKTLVWSMPKAVEGASVLMPKADMRVRVRRREGLEVRPRVVNKQK